MDMKRLKKTDSMKEGGLRLLAVSNGQADRAICQFDELQTTMESEELLTEISKAFINLPPTLVDGTVEDCLKRIGEGFNLDRATLTEIDIVNGELAVTYKWSRPGPARETDRSLDDALPWLVDVIRKGQVSVIPRPGEHTSLVIPLVVGGKLAAALSLDTFHQNHSWNQVLISRLQQAGYVFANALARKHAEERLQAAYTTISELKRKLEREDFFLRDETRLEHDHCSVIGQSNAIRGILKKVEQVAPTDSAVLLLGETGTGKELIARRIHELSRRKSRPIVKVNCAAMPAALIESELFGREKGAYTGALSREIGRFELAHDSTIFLDEIGEMPIELQAKLLRVLQDGEFERLGSSRTLRVDVRVLAATNRDLKAAIKAGKFREDLYYRLSVFPVEMPPLRERREDLPALVWHLLKEQCARMGRDIKSIDSATMKRFLEYSWPGNVRELRNVIERHLILNPGPVFHAEVPDAYADFQPVGRNLDEVERNHVHRVLQSTRWRIRGSGGAAEILGLKPTTLEARIKKLGVVRPA